MRPRPSSILSLLFLIALLAGARGVEAHGVDPIGVSIQERAGGKVTLRIDRPAAIAQGALLVRVDAGCAESSATTRAAGGTRLIEEHELDCERALAGSRVTIEGMADAQLDVVLRAELQDGVVHRGVVTARDPQLELPARARPLSTLAAYLALGARHLALGLDHLLFVLGIVVVTGRARRAALALSAFTVGHSLTLCAAALGWLRFPAAWAEVGIAASLIWLALAVVRGERQEGRARLALVCAGVGLVHGLGFAAALADVGLPASDVPLALLGFNLGIELTQLAIVAALFGGALLARRSKLAAREWPRQWLGHAIGALSVMWCIERILATAG